MGPRYNLQRFPSFGAWQVDVWGPSLCIVQLCPLAPPPILAFSLLSLEMEVYETRGPEYSLKGRTPTRYPRYRKPPGRWITEARVVFHTPGLLVERAARRLTPVMPPSRPASFDCARGASSMEPDRKPSDGCYRTRGMLSQSHEGWLLRVTRSAVLGCRRKHDHPCRSRLSPQALNPPSTAV